MNIVATILDKLIFDYTTDVVSYTLQMFANAKIEMPPTNSREKLEAYVIGLENQVVELVSHDIRSNKIVERLIENGDNLSALVRWSNYDYDVKANIELDWHKSADEWKQAKKVINE